MIEYKDFKFEDVSSVSPEGVIEGILSPYDNVDLGKDIVRKGAFARTLNAQKNRIPALLDHDPTLRIGVHYLEDTVDGLKTSLRLNLDKELARDALSDVKFWHQNGLTFGLSIGYETVQKKFVGEIRELLEVQLWEGSLTAFPMNQSARTSGAKDIRSLYDDVKAGRAISASNLERLRRMHDDLSALLSVADTSEPATPQDDPSNPTLVAQLKQLNTLFEVK